MRAWAELFGGLSLTCIIWGGSMGSVFVDWRRRRTLASVDAHTVHAQSNPECRFHVAQFDGPVAGRANLEQVVQDASRRS